MNQIKIGKFIAQCRKEKNITQSQLAESLGITDKAVSKWENGKGMPDVSIMLSLCDELGINVNELLSGERLTDDNYMNMANKNILVIAEEVEKNKKTKERIIKASICVIAICIILFIGLYIFENVHVNLVYNKGIMECEINQESIVYTINGKATTSEYRVINTDTETLIFFNSKEFLKNRVFETYTSQTRYTYSMDEFGKCKDKIKIYYASIPLKKIDPENEEQMKNITSDFYLMAQN